MNDLDHACEHIKKYFGSTREWATSPSSQAIGPIEPLQARSGEGYPYRKEGGLDVIPVPGQTTHIPLPETRRHWEEKEDLGVDRSKLNLQQLGDVASAYKEYITTHEVSAQEGYIKSVDEYFDKMGISKDAKTRVLLHDEVVLPEVYNIVFKQTEQHKLSKSLDLLVSLLYASQIRLQNR